MADAVVREGFLCPICVQDLGNVADLQLHFDVAHAEEDKAVINQLKDFFGKAKQKLLNNMKKEKESADVFSEFSGEGDVPVSESGRVFVGGIDPTMWDPQEIGATRSYTDGFKRYRDSRMDRFVVETNKLLIRLDKLLSPEAPTEVNKRKAFEKSVVPWAPDSDVSLCTACGKRFSITRRRHHCRLCGGIICNRCSQFLPFSYAKKLTNPAYEYEGEGFRRSSSSSSLNSILSPEGEPHIRTCAPCRVLLERRDQQIEQRNRKPFLVQLYEKMQKYMEESNKILPTYFEMLESLNSGETTYSLKDASQYRTQIVKLFETIDLLSKRIYTLGTTDASAEDAPSPTTLRLQKMVRSHASNYLQSNMLGLQALPSEEELAGIRERKRIEAQQRIEEERRLAAEREKQQQQQRRQPKTASRETSPTKQQAAAVPPSVELGWQPKEITNTGSSDDPMIQQMNIIRGYMKQAKQAQKWDEAKMLEENLKELQKEYWRLEEASKMEQQQQQQQQQQKQERLQQQRQQQQQAVGQQQPRQYVGAADTGRPRPQQLAQQQMLRSSGNSGQAGYQGNSQQRQAVSPKRSPTKMAENTANVRRSPVKAVSPGNPFEETDDKSGSFEEDATNPFSDKYEDRSQGDSLNPFL